MTSLATSQRTFARIWIVRLILLIPAVAFYAILALNSINLPVADDYAALEFINMWAEMNSITERLAHMLFYQHNEYKLVFANATLAIQYGLTGHLNFEVLIAFSSIFVLLTFFFLLAIYRVPSIGHVDNLLFLLPVSLLLFQLQYAAALIPAIGSLQYLPAIFFSFLAIFFLCKHQNTSLAAACTSMVLAVSASLNGLILAPLGVLILIQQKRWKSLLIWIIAAFTIAGIYFTHHNFHVSPSAQGAPVNPPFLRISPAYAFSFLGASVARYQSYSPSLIFGLLLTAVFLLSIKMGYYRKNPPVFYCTLLIIATAFGVSGLRSELGIAQSLVSRYRIYSNLFVILSYIFLTEIFVPRIKTPSTKYTMLGFFVLFCLAFTAMSDRAGDRFLQGRKKAVIYEMVRWQNSAVGLPIPKPEVGTDTAIIRQLASGLYTPVGPILIESIQRDIYHPPPINLTDR
jgi:hypothetical protein